MEARIATRFGLGRLRQPEIHVEPAGDVLREIAFQPVARCRETRQMKNRPLHESAAGLFCRMLIERNDIGACIGQKAAHRGYQAWAVRTPKEEPAEIRSGGHPLNPP